MQNQANTRIAHIMTLLCLLCAAVCIAVVTICLHSAVTEAKALEQDVHLALARLDTLTGEMSAMNENLTGIAQLAETLNDTFLLLKEKVDAVQFDLRDVLPFGIK